MSRITDLAEKRVAALDAAKAVLDGAGDKALTAEQRSLYDSNVAIADDCEADIIKERRTQEHREAVVSNPLLSGYSPSGENRSNETQAAVRGLLPSFAEYRALNEGTGSAGGWLVPVQQADQAFSYLATQTVVLNSGVRVLPMSEDVVNVPRVSAGATVAMTAEAASITEVDPTVAQTVLTARKAAAFILVSNEVLDDSSPSVRDIVATDLLGQLGRFLDLQFLAGSGSGVNLLGIRNFAGVTSTAAGTNGASFTLDMAADAIGRAQSGNNSLDDLVWYMHPKVWAEVRKLKDSQNRYLVAPDPTAGTPLSLFSVPVAITSALPTNEVQGTSGAVCSSALLVNRKQVIVGRRAEINVQYSTDYAFQTDQTAIKATARFSIGLLDSNGVQIVTGII